VGATVQEGLGKMSTLGRHWDSQGKKGYLKAERFSHRLQMWWPPLRRKATAENTYCCLPEIRP